jgi:uncharacterized protein with GYD domain
MSISLDVATGGSKEDVRRQGLLQEGGTRRRDTLSMAIEALGSRLEAFYYTFGDRDVIVIYSAPDEITATIVLSMAANKSGSVRLTTTPLLTAEDFDQTANKSVGYRPPGA